MSSVRREFIERGTEGMNYLTLIRQAKNALDEAYELAQRPDFKIDTETLLINAQNKINMAIIELRKDSAES